MTLPIVTIDRPRSYPPRVTAFTRTFWSALAEGRLITTRCTACGRFSFPPKPICPHCWASAPEWADLPGTGRLYSRTTIHAVPAAFRDEGPIMVGIVDLDAGVRLAARILDDGGTPPDGRVEAVVLRFADGPLFAFRPIAGG